MRRRLLNHIILEKGEDDEENKNKRLLPVFLHYDDSQWREDSCSRMWEDVMSIIVQNLDIIEHHAKSKPTIESPPIQLTADSGEVTLAFTTRDRPQYPLLTLGDESPKVQELTEFELFLWIFRVNKRLPHQPLPMECG